MKNKVKTGTLLVLLLTALMVLSACGRKNSAAGGTTTNTNAMNEEITDVDKSDIWDISATSTDIADMSDITSESISEPNSVPEIEWTIVTTTKTDTDGYTYEITYRLSPWILLSNTDLINAAWQEIGNGNTLPGYDDWGLRMSGNVMFRQGISYGGSTTHFLCDMNDMYYCLGTVQIKNVTEGWSISEGNLRSVHVSLSWKYDRLSSPAASIGRTFYSNEIDEESNGIFPQALLQSDTWGSVPFVIMAPENFSPNFPSGEYLDFMRNGHFTFGSNEPHFVGIIGKDGEYFAPTAE